VFCRLVLPEEIVPVYWQRLLILLISASLGACSNAFVYNQMDWLIPWYVDDYVDFTREQKADFKAQLIPLLEWHRTEELDSYLLILNRIEADIQQPVTAEAISAWTDEFVAAYQRIEKRSMPLAFELGEQASDAQIAHFMAELYEEQDDYEEEYLTRSEEKVRERGYKNMVDNVDDVLGRLEPEQKETLRAAADQLQRFDAIWLSQRRWWLEQTEEVLRREPGWQERALDLMERREELESPEYREINEQNQLIIYTALAEVLNSRTEKQDKRLRRELDGFREDLQALIGDQ
jgi:hypothetical protein